MASEEATYQCKQLEVALVIPEEEVTTGLEERVMTMSIDNAAHPIDITIVTMLHDYAMEQLFSFLPMADLKNCRLVNRSWNNVSNRAIQKRNYLIHFGEYYDYPHLRGLNRCELDIPELDQDIRSSFQFPWTKFKLQARDFSPSAEEDEDLQLGDLLPVINSFVTELEICYLQSLQSLEYPSLRKLTLRYDPSKGVPSGDNWTSLLRLVETAFNLDEIDIKGFLNTPLFMDVLEVANCRNISRLSLSWWIGGEQLVRISQMNFQLKFLSLVFGMFDTSAENVRTVLESQSNCLEHLELTCHYIPWEQLEVDLWWKLGMEFPVMKKLKLLSVRSQNMYSRISYKAMFPVLKTLKVDDFDDYYSLDESFLNGDIEPVETVECLRLGGWPQPHVRSPETILQAAKQFPKLRRVFLIVKQNLLSTVGLAMPQLEEMELVFYKEDNMDSILTGLSSQEVDALKGLPSNQLDAVERCKAPVLFLKNLKMLRFSIRKSGTWRTEVASLSDFGCRFALLKMQHLQVLELKGNFSQISDQVMERMQAKFVVLLEN